VFRERQFNRSTHSGFADYVFQLKDSSYFVILECKADLTEVNLHQLTQQLAKYQYVYSFWNHERKERHQFTEPHGVVLIGDKYGIYITEDGQFIQCEAGKPRWHRLDFKTHKVQLINDIISTTHNLIEQNIQKRRLYHVNSIRENLKPYQSSNPNHKYLVDNIARLGDTNDGLRLCIPMEKNFYFVCIHNRWIPVEMNYEAQAFAPTQHIYAYQRQFTARDGYTITMSNHGVCLLATEKAIFMYHITADHEINEEKVVAINWTKWHNNPLNKAEEVRSKIFDFCKTHA
jgi:hypothetical protein